MSATAYGRWGRQITDPSPDEIIALLAELDGPEDEEHPDVWIDHESGWSLSALPSGLVVWENVEADAEEGPVHLRDVPRDLTAELFRAVAAGRLDAVRNRPWAPGYG